MDATGALLPGGAVDPHWRLIRSPDATAPGPQAYVVLAGYPIPPWLAQGPASQWIAPKANQSGGSAAGDYTYRLSFDLSAFDPDTVVLRGRWSSDNAGLEVRLNGQRTSLAFDGNFGAFSPEFTLTAGFLDGTNTLDFGVNNAGTDANPTGFRAELAATAEPWPAPGTPPRITRQPQSWTVPFKDPARFDVTVYGSRPLAYQWRRAGRPLPGATQAAWLVPFAGVADGGRYDVVVANAFGAVTSAPATLTLTFPSPAALSYEPPGPSSRRTGLAFTEVHYRPAPRADGRELAFVELYNSNPFFEDLSGWRLAGDVDFTFPPGTRLEGRSYLVLAARPADVAAVYGLTHALGPWTGRLPAAGGTVRLRKAAGAIVLEVQYRNRPPWPVAADGAGHSLVLARPSFGENDPRAWVASATRGGSPGGADPVPDSPLDGLVFSEVLAAPAAGQHAWLELHNASARPVDLTGCGLSDDPRVVKHRVAAGTVLGGGEFIVLDEAQLGFAPDAAGGRLWLTAPDDTRVLDAVTYAASTPGVSLGRSAAAPGELRESSASTPRAPNAPGRTSEVVINEVLFHPLSGDGAEEFVEVLNRGANRVALGGWRFLEGLEYEFPAGTVLDPGGFLVVARDAARFRRAHPALATGSVLGDFQGALSDRGERLQLAQPISVPGGRVAWRIAAEAAYTDGSPTSRWADGGGSSLERVDARADPLLADAWADSLEAGRADWTLVEATGVLDHTHPAVPNADQLQVLLLGAGEALVDEVEVRVGAGANRVANGTFEAGLTGWFAQGTHRRSHLEDGTAYAGTRSLHLVATERGDHVANRLRTALSPTIPTGQTATIRARVRWLAGHPEILLRLRGGGVEAVGRLATPSSAGTPGRPNTRAAPNTGPALAEVRHRPVLPAAGQPVRVFVRVSDPDGVASVTLRYRVDPAPSLAGVSLIDDGTGPDEQAGDGVFTGAIPGQPAGALVAFHLEATDAAAAPATRRFPADAPGREALIRFGEPSAPSAFGAYRLWLTEAGRVAWAGREKMSNDDVDVTFVYGAHRAIHESGAHYSGSSYTAPIYDSPTGALCGYDLSFPKSDRFLGDTRLTLDWPIRDPTDQREQLMFWFLDQYGLPNMYRRYVHLFVNGLRRGTIYDDVQQPGRDTVDEWFADDADGSLWKTDCWNEFDPAGQRVDPCLLNTLQPFTTAGGALKPARYRWNWRPRAVRGSANDFTDLFALVAAVNATNDYLARVEAQVDVGHWMRTFAMNDLASFWDAFGNPNAKNTFLYKPRRGPWQLLCWDFDVGLGVFNDPPTAALFEVNDPALARMYRTPAFVRLYWAALQEALDGFFQVGAGTRLEALLDAKYAAFQAERLGLASPAPIKSWIAQRRSNLLAQLNSVRAPFAIASPPASIVTDQNPLIVRGTAPVQVRDLRVNGLTYTPTWTSVTAWELRVPLLAAHTTLRLEGVDRLDRLVPGASAALAVQFTGTPPPPPPVRINEWMAANRAAVPDPADGAFDDWFELHNAGPTPVSLAGWRLSDRADPATAFVVPPGFTLPARGFLVVWADEQPAQNVPPDALHVTFKLNQNGETLRLFDPAGRLVDEVAFGPQTPDASEGRWPDAAPAPFSPLAPPTAGAPNRIAPDHGPTLRILDATLTPAGTLTLRWTSQPGRLYRVLYRAELTDGSWLALPGDVAAEGATAAKQDAPGATAARRYYRVQLLAEPPSAASPP